MGVTRFPGEPATPDESYWCGSRAQRCSHPVLDAKGVLCVCLAQVDVIGITHGTAGACGLSPIHSFPKVSEGGNDAAQSSFHNSHFI